jgi:DNA-binding CsgD family transcriptional regulator
VTQGAPVRPPSIKPKGITAVRAMQIALAALGGDPDTVVDNQDQLDQEALAARREEELEQRVRECVGYLGLTVPQTAERLGVSRHTVDRVRKNLGLIMYRSRGHSSTKGVPHAEHDRIRETIREMHESGATDPEIGKTLGLSASAVKGRRERMGLRHRNRINPQAKYEREFGQASLQLNDRIRELHAEGLDDKAIADKLGKTREGIRRRRILMELPSHLASGQGGRRNEPLIADLTRLLGEGLTDRQIGEQLGYSREEIGRYRFKYGLPCNPATPTRHHDRAVMKKLVDRGYSQTKIARTLDIQRSTVQRWLTIHGLTTK